MAGSWAYQLSSPVAVVLDQYDNIYIMDATNNRIQRWRQGATYGVTLVSATMSSPRGIAIDGSGNLLVADSNYDRILLFPVYCRKLHYVS